MKRTTTIFFMIVLVICGRAHGAALPDNPYMKLYQQTNKINVINLYSDITKLEEKLEKAKAREQSTANKILGAAAIGLSGIGGMQLMQGRAEQTADADAERDMRAYLATFVCDYGRGRNIRGGDMNIETPGGNDMIAQVTEYRTLAADLRARKEALGLRPGIEADVILDTAETGLYDNAAIGRQSGAYTSLSRAITDKNSKDAAEWDQQKADSASQTKTGAITAGTGAVGGMVGNLIINKDANKADDGK